MTVLVEQSSRSTPEVADLRRRLRLHEEENERLRASLAECREQWSAVTGQCSMHLDNIVEYQAIVERLEAQVASLLAQQGPH